MRMADRADVSLHLKKVRIPYFELVPTLRIRVMQPFLCLAQMWKKHYKVDGQVTQHLSPFEQNIVSPLFKYLIPNTIQRITKFVTVAGPAVATGLAVYYWAEWKHKDLAYHHRN